MELYGKALKKLLPLILLFSSQLSAEPNKTTEYLMNDSLSMFEWGIFRVEEALSDVRFPELEVVYKNHPNLNYDWDTNQLEIQLSIYPSHQKLKEIGPKGACKIGLSDLRGFFGIGSPDVIHDILGLQKYFRHKFFFKKNVTKTFANDIENMTQLTINIHSSENDKPLFDKKAKCTSKLLKDEVYFVDEL